MGGVVCSPAIQNRCRWLQRRCVMAGEKRRGGLRKDGDADVSNEPSWLEIMQ